MGNERQLSTRQNDQIIEDPGDTSSPFLRNLIVVPQQSGWFNSWKFLVNMLLFAGYINDPLYIAFTIGRLDQFVERGETGLDTIVTPSHTLEMIVDIAITMDMIL